MTADIIFKLQVRDAEGWGSYADDPESIAEAADVACNDDLFDKYNGSVRLVHIDLTDAMKPVATDITGDLLKILGQRSNDNAEVPDWFLEAAFKAAGVNYWSRADQRMQDRENAGHER
ncbi:MAG: hypothetical protein ACRCXM_11480, partial [Beijerinckiaceae bacterium]